MNGVNEYLDKLPPEEQAALNRIRKLIIELVPEVEESMSYGMPAFKYKKKPLVYFGAFKNHLSLFPTSKPIEVLKDHLADYKISKGAIQFTVDNQLSDNTIKQLIEIRKQAILISK